MPSPIGHLLGGIAAGWLAAGPAPSDRFGLKDGPGRASDMRREAAVFGALGMAPDLDLLVGAHSTYTHSLGAVVLTAIAALVWTRRLRLAVASAAAVASHVLLDWLGSDTTPPLGIMALWPLTREFYQSHAFLFMAISRRWWLPGFYAQNGIAALRELAILLPIVLLIGIAWRRFGVRAYWPQVKDAHGRDRK